MTPAFKAMNKAVNIVINSFDKLASKDPVDAASIKSARKELAKASVHLDKFKDSINKANQNQKQFNKSLKSGTDLADTLASKIKSFVSAYLGIAAIKKGIGFIKESLEAAKIQTNAELQLKVTLSNMGAVDDAFEQIKNKASEIQSRGMFGDEAMIAGAAEFSTYMSDSQAIQSMMDTLANYAIGMSNGEAVGRDEMVNYATNLGKIMTGAYDAMTKKGFQFTESQKAVISGTATHAQYVEVLGENYKSMSEDMQKATTINNIITESWGNLYETMSNTPTGKIQQLKNAFGDFQETVGNRVTPQIMYLLNKLESNMPQIEFVILGIADAFGVMAKILGTVVNICGSVVAIFKNNWSLIEPIIWGIVAALAAHNAALLLSKDGIIATASAQAWKIACDWAENAAILALIAAQDGFNAALKACPITWIINAIIVIISSVYTIVAAVNKLQNKTTSATGVICGAVATAGTFILNSAIGVVNSLLQSIWSVANSILGIVEWVLNACNGGFNSFGGMVSNLIGKILAWFLNLGKVVTVVIDAICGTNWTNKLESMQNNMRSWGKNEKAITLTQNAPQIKRIEYKQAWDMGYSFGSGIEEKIGSMFNGGDAFEEATKKLQNNTDLENNLNNIYDNTGAIADNTDNINNTLSVSDNDLKYLRELAEREAINKFTTSVVKVDMTNNNSINSDLDIDGVVRSLEIKLNEALINNVEGVHI